MIRVIVLSALLATLTVAGHGYNPPLPGYLAVIRNTSDPDQLWLWVSVSGECGVNVQGLRGLVESEMIRNRIEVVAVPLSIDVTVICFKTTTGNYVYTVNPVLKLWEPDGEDFVFWIIDLLHQVVGITRNPDDIEEAVEDGARDVLTDSSTLTDKILDSLQTEALPTAGWQMLGASSEDSGK